MTQATDFYAQMLESQRRAAEQRAETRAALAVTERALAHGLMVRPLPSDTIGICPPLIITEPQIDELFDMLEVGLNEALAHLRGAG